MALDAVTKKVKLNKKRADFLRYFVIEHSFLEEQSILKIRNQYFELKFNQLQTRPLHLPGTCDKACDMLPTTWPVTTRASPVLDHHLIIIIMMMTEERVECPSCRPVAVIITSMNMSP